MSWTWQKWHWFIGFQRHQTINVKILRKLFGTGTHKDTTKVCGDWQVGW